MFLFISYTKKYQTSLKKYLSDKSAYDLIDAIASQYIPCQLDQYFLIKKKKYFTFQNISLRNNFIRI